MIDRCHHDKLLKKQQRSGGKNKLTGRGSVAKTTLLDVGLRPRQWYYTVVFIYTPSKITP
jgi:hypothetical protein